MRLISRHILRTLAAPFFWGVIALTGMLFLNALPPMIDRLGGKGIPFQTMAEAALLLMPALMSLTLPMAVLVSVLYGYSRLAADLEMVAMYANGISVWRMARPALVAAAVIAVINFFVFDQVAPKSAVRLNNVSQGIAQKLPTLALREQVLNVLPARRGYILRADVIDQETGGLKHVTIFDLTDNAEQVRRLIVADSGTMAESADGKDLVLTLHSGAIYEFKPKDPTQMQQTNFIDNRIVVRDVQNNLSISSANRFRSQQELSTCELLDQIDETRATRTQSRFENEYFTRTDLHVLLALPQPQRAQQAPQKVPEHCGKYRKFEAWFKTVMLPAKASAQEPPKQQPVQQPPVQQPAVQQPVVQGTPQTPPGTAPVVPGTQGFLVPPAPQQSPLTARFNVENGEVVAASMRAQILVYQVEYHQKIAVPLSSFCFVLIGLAVALKYPGGGIGLVIGGSLVIFLGFYILLQGGRSAALTGHLDPAIAAYVPLGLFTVIGILSVNSANREMGNVRGGGVLDSIAAFFRRKKGRS